MYIVLLVNNTKGTKNFNIDKTFCHRVVKRPLGFLNNQSISDKV